MRDIDPHNDLTFVRVRSKKYELIIAPGNLSISQNILLNTIIYYVNLFHDFNVEIRDF